MNRLSQEWIKLMKLRKGESMTVATQLKCLRVGDIIRRKRDGYEFEILEVSHSGYVCRDLFHKVTWVFTFPEAESGCDRVFQTNWGESRR